MPRLCLFGCRPLGVTLHSFPNPKKFPARFQMWVNLVGGKLESASDYDYYKKMKICDIHFTKQEFNRYNRLNALAVPSLYLSGASDISEISNSNQLREGHQLQHSRMHKVLHRFPNPDKDNQRFTTWLNAIGGTILKLDKYHIYKYRRVCHSHFEVKYLCRNDRISRSALPTSNMSGVTLHHFPNPDTDIERFRTWVMNIGGDIIGLDDYYIYKNRRVCSLHFHSMHIYTKKLSLLAIPQLSLPAADKILHTFPHPVKDKDRFNAWIFAIGGEVIGLDNDFIFKQRRVCHSHFEEKFLCRNKRISNNAVPTLHLQDMKNYRYWITVKGRPVLKPRIPRSLCTLSSMDSKIVELGPSTSTASIKYIDIRDIEMNIGCFNSGVHLFPKNSALKKKWETSIRRKNFIATQHSRLCRSHFKESDYVGVSAYTGQPQLCRFLKKGTVPSIFPWSTQVSTTPSSRALRHLERSRHQIDFSQPPVTVEEVIPEPATSIEIEIAASNSLPGDDTDTPKTVSVGIQCHSFLGILSLETLRGNQKAIHFYTGLESYEKFLLVLDTLSPVCEKFTYKGSQVINVSTADQLLITLIKLRQYPPDFELSFQFGVSESSIANIFITWINFIYRYLAKKRIGSTFYA